jgi:predicted glycoside hydrolase/deacetylase ChbG (UPF0249 family)
MKWLIVTADDFGLTTATNCGIVEAHRKGILTSASLMVDRGGSFEAAAMARACPSLSVGLHLELEGALDPDDVAFETRRQFERFLDLVGAAPTHIDSHHEVHRDPRVLPHVLACGAEASVPVRGHSPARHVGSFYGRWGGESHFERIGVAGLVRLLCDEVHDGVTELTCHPGEPEPDRPSSYDIERAVELQTLCDPRIREALVEERIRLIGFRDLPGVARGLGRSA